MNYIDTLVELIHQRDKKLGIVPADDIQQKRNIDDWFLMSIKGVRKSEELPESAEPPELLEPNSLVLWLERYEL
jgi:hypothetical protein